MCDTIEEIFNKDKLNIKKYVIDFANLLKQETFKKNLSSKVYSISAEFGIGKTFLWFIERIFIKIFLSYIKIINNQYILIEL